MNALKKSEAIALPKNESHVPGYRYGRPTPEYSTWLSLRARCLNPAHVAYERYGGSGITVCERWNDFQNFYKDMGPRPGGTSIDRIDSSKGYFPENCRWATASVQRLNRRPGITVEINGEVLTLQNIAARTGLTYGAIHRRYNKGYRGDELLQEATTDFKRAREENLNSNL